MSSRESCYARWAAIVVAASATGCFPSLTLTAQQAVATKPSNVLVYFSAETNSGRPVTNLGPDAFSIFENGARVTSVEGRQTLLRPTATHYTLFLVDMSGRVIGAKEAGEVIKAASILSEGAEKADNVIAVYSFDGSPDLVPVVPFATSRGGPHDAGEAPAARERRGPPMGIESAVVAGLRTLNVSLAADPSLFKAGTLVLFTDETNHADRMRITDLHAALTTPDNRKIEMIAVGVGADIDDTRLEDLGRNGTILESDPANMRKAFDAAVARVKAASKHYYLLSYCTPARAGAQNVRVETHAADGLMGELTYTFNADGFAPGCDPTAPQTLVAKVPPPADDKSTREPAEPKEPKRAHRPHPSTPTPQAAPAAPTAPTTPAAEPATPAPSPPPVPKPPAAKPPPPKPAKPPPPPPASDPFAP
jgi:hypothetical protein